MINELRRYIRKLILEKGEFRQKYQAGHGSFQFSNQENIDIKKWFHKNADQKSLQKLVYVHWGDKNQIFKLLQTAWKNNNRSRSEINTLIYKPGAEMKIFNLDYDSTETKIGLLVKGWVSMASNIDLDSGRMSGVDGNLRNPNDKKILQQQIKFGLNKRPNVQMVKDRIIDSTSGDESPVYVGDEQLWDADDWTKALILKASDFQPQPDISEEMENMTLNWPEAFVDNWKPMAIVVHTNLQPDYWFELIDDVGLPLIDENREVWTEIYEEYVDYQAENIQYELDNDDEYELEDYEKRFLQANEEGDITIAFPYLAGWL